MHRLGLYLVRGDNMYARENRFQQKLTPRRSSAVVGELDEELDANLDLTVIRAPPLKAIFG